MRISTLLTTKAHTAPFQQHRRTPVAKMGCFTSRIAGPDFTTINADMSASPIHRHKSEADTSHYETAEEHDRDLQRLSTSQRRPSRPAYVDPNDQPMPPKTTHQHYHRRASENTPQQESNTGWKEKVKNAVMTPADERGMGMSSPLINDIVFLYLRHRLLFGNETSSQCNERYPCKTSFPLKRSLNLNEMRTFPINQNEHP